MNSKARPVVPSEGDLWTTAEASEALRVSVSSVKRWTDEGDLDSVRTPGGHRRYTLLALHRFARERGLDADRLPPALEAPPGDIPAGLSLIDALLAGDGEAIRRLVVPPPGSVSARAAFLDRVVGGSLRHIGELWKGGDIGVDVEHRASHQVEEAIDDLRPRAAAGGPLVILACPPGDLHELPLRLVRVVFEWMGWRTELAGAQLPWDSARAAVKRSGAAILAYSARSAEPFALDEFAAIVRDCRRRSTTVITGGEWARGGAHRRRGYLRFRTLHGLEKWLRTQRG